MDRPKSSDSAVLSIECVAGSSRAEEWGGGEALQTGDVVEEIRIGGTDYLRPPFKGGRAEVQKLLRTAFKRGDTSINVRVRRDLGRPEGTVTPPMGKHLIQPSV